MLESIGKFRWQSAPFSAWLFRIAHNLAMDHFRASKRWQPEEEVPEPEPDEATSAEAGALESIGRRSMLELIEDLSPEQQQVLTLKFVFNFANAEAATILGKTEGAIKSLQHRALVSLQKQIEQREAEQLAATLSLVALEVGIVGPSGSGKTSLFTALTKTGGGEYGKTNVGMAPIADERLAALAAVVKARKITPATIRVQDVPGSGAAQLGNLRQVDALLVVLRGFGADATPDDDLETFKLELLVADRDHVERRLERVEKQAKSGDAKIRAELEELRKVLAHVDARRRARELRGRAAGRARAADDEAADRDRERPGRDRPEARGRARRAARRGGGGVPRRQRVGARRDRRPARAGARPDHVLHGGREGHARVDAPQRPDRARRGRRDPLGHRARLHPLRGRRLAATSSSSARTPRSQGTASSGSRARPTSSRTATC